MTDNCNPISFAKICCAVLQGVLVIFNLGCTAAKDNSPNQTLRLATTTTTYDSGLIEYLIPTFEQKHQVQIDVIAVGTGKALKLGESGNVDVLLVHARQAEDDFLAAGHGTRRETVMMNFFQLVGPAEDPAGVEKTNVGMALQKIAKQNEYFVSRGDDSGTHQRELALWQQNGEFVRWKKYLETGQGMGATLTIADQLGGYTLTDRGTYLRYQKKIRLVSLSTASDELKNPYSIIVVHPDKTSPAQAALANTFVDYIISPAVQTQIGNYQQSGESLFFPVHFFE